MKYRIILIGLMLGMTFSITGCQKTENTQDVVSFDDIKPEEPEPVIIREEMPQSEEESTTEMETETETEIIEPFCNLEQVAYDVTDETYEQDGVKICYPQLINMENQELQTAINERVKQTVIPSDLEITGITYEVSYEIATQGTGILSLVFRGYYEEEGTVHPNQFVKTLNIKLSTGENVRLKDYADLEAIVSDLELAQGYTILSEDIDPADFSAFLNNGYVTDYAITLLDYDVDFSQDLAVSGYSYIKDNYVVLCIETEHALGDYVEIMFDKQIQ